MKNEWIKCNLLAVFVTVTSLVTGLNGAFAMSGDDALKSAILKSRFSAHDIVRRAYEAENTAAYEHVSILYMHVEAKTFTDREAARHDETWQRDPITDDLYFFWDFKNNKFRGFQFRETHGGLVEMSETLVKDETAYFIKPAARTYRQREMRLDAVHGYVGHGFHAWLDIVSPLTPLMWKQMRFGVSHIESATVDGERADAIEAPWPSSPRRPRYYVSQETGKILMGLSYFPDPLDGDISTLIRYIGRKEINGLPVPELLTVNFTNGWKEERVIKDIRVLETLPDGFFDLTKGLQPAPDPWRMADISESVKEVKDPWFDGINLHYVVFDDFVMVVDTPPSGTAARYLIDLIGKETGKPIEYLVLSHGHDLNIGGVREFAAIGATIVTSRSAKNLVDRFIRAPGSRFGGTADREPLADDATIELVSREQPLVIEDESKSVTVQNIGDLPHAEEVLAVSLAKENILITGDVYSNEAPQSTTAKAFFEWAEAQNIGNPIVVGSRHIAAPLVELREDSNSAQFIMRERLDLIEEALR